MTVSASATTTVAVDARTLLEFVLDLERYKQVDRKIVRVGRVDAPDQEGKGSVRLWGRVRWTPPSPDKHDIVLQRWRSLTFTGAPRQPARLIFDFTGTFACRPVDAGTEMTHAYEFTFKGPFRVLERGLGPWLQAELDDEVAAVRAAIER